jgi:hypothetical protein
MNPEDQQRLLFLLTAISDSLEKIAFTLRVLERDVGTLHNDMDSWTPTAYEYEDDNNE